MSLSLLDRLTLLVHPQGVVLERRTWRGTTARESADVAVPADSQADWQPALAAAEGLLFSAGRGGRLRVIVADQFVRYALLPWSDAIITSAGRLAMARALFKSSLGEKAEGLTIALDRPAFGKNGIAAGLDGQLLAGLRSAAKARRLRLSSLQPHAIAELAGAGKQLTDGWIACVDRAWLTLVGLRGNQITFLGNHRVANAESESFSRELAGLLASKVAMAGSHRVFLVGQVKALPMLPTPWEIKALPTLYGVSHA